MKNYGLIILLFASISVFGQKDLPTEGELDSGTIENQFDYIINKSRKFKDFHLIRQTSIVKVKKNTLDSLKVFQKELNATKTNLNESNAKTKQLETEITDLRNNVEAVSKERDSISFLGMSLSKSGYSKMVWAIIILLALALAFFIFQFKNSKVVTIQSKTDLNKLNDAFEEFRKKALKREQEVMRKLQDELNKNNH